MPNALNLKDFLEHFELTLLSILHPRYNSIPAENRMGDTISLKITDKALYIQHLDRSRTTAMDGGSADIAGANTCRPPWMVEVQILQEQIPVDRHGWGSAGFAYVHGWTVVGQRICTGCTVVGQCRSYCRGAVHRSI